MEKFKSSYFYELIVLALGCFLIALGLNMFLEPFTIASGGLTGLAIILKKLFGIELWVINLVCNIPLFFFGLKYLGKKDISKTLIGIALLTFFLGVTKSLTSTHATNDILLACLTGGIILGAAMGILFRINASTGGTELACLILNKIFPSISISTFMLIIDGIVVILAGIVTKSIEPSLYATVSLYISVKVCDAIVEGFNFSKSFIIVTDKSSEISTAIMDTLDRGITLLEGRGAYTRTEKEVILVVVSRREEVTLKRLVHEIDPLAFTIITDAHEVLGEGFSRK